MAELWGESPPPERPGGQVWGWIPDLGEAPLLALVLGFLAGVFVVLALYP